MIKKKICFFFLYLIPFSLINADEIEKKFPELSLRALQGEVQAQYLMGEKYYSTLGKGIDLQKAFYWFNLAALNGSNMAQNKLGEFYQTGIHVPRDNKKSLFWYQKAARNNNLNAIISLAVLYQTGLIVEANYKESAYWYMQAVRLITKTNSNQILNFSLPDNSFEVVFIHKEAVKRGIDEAIWGLGLIFEFDEGLDIEKKYAVAAYFLALEKLPEKYKDSIKAYISMINSTMSRQDFEQGKKIYEKGYENFLKIVEKKFYKPDELFKSERELLFTLPE